MRQRETINELNMPLTRYFH